MIELKSIYELLDMNLTIPSYQRAYKWTDRNIFDLLTDISNAIDDGQKYDRFKYRIGTIILHRVEEENGVIYNIVDGQQRILSIVLLSLFLDEGFNCPLLENTQQNSQDKEEGFLQNKITQSNIYKNYRFISNWFSARAEKRADFIFALKNIIEVVVITVDKEDEAFQLFDSQNTRGKALDPHDLLKAYHLREMKNFPYDMRYSVKKWEEHKAGDIRELFELYLFPIRQWANGKKSVKFSEKEIDAYRGISERESYSYAKRAGKASPYYQITEPFISGSDFFDMVEHYLKLLNDIRTEVKDNLDLPLAELFGDRKTAGSDTSGLKYAKNLFYCALLCYYDRFRNFDKQAVKNLFTWAFMLRVDMQKLGFDSINKYAIGEYTAKYSNCIAMFSRIVEARLHSEIANCHIEVGKNHDGQSESRDALHDLLKGINGYSDE